MYRLSHRRAQLQRLLESPVIQHGRPVQIPPPTYRWREPDDRLRLPSRTTRTIRLVLFQGAR